MSLDHTHAPSGPGHGHNYGPSYSGTVMLDIGAEAGALVIVTPPAMVGEEIEISGERHESTCDSHADRTHMAVRERHLGDRTMHCAVYPKLLEDVYTIWYEDLPVARVEIRGAEVTQYTWKN
jgi:hypothetical protein